MRHEISGGPSEHLETEPQTWQERVRAAAIAPALGELSLDRRTVLDTYLGRTAIQIGVLELPYSISRETSDYSEHRYRFFRTLTKHQSQIDSQPHGALTPRDIWRQIGEDGKLDSNTMLAIKKWLPGLSYFGQPLVVSSGKRGRGSRYAINPVLYLDVVDKYRELSSDLPQPEEVYEAVRHLAQFDFVMREHGVLRLDPELEMSLEGMRPDYREITSRGGSVAQFRAAALSKLDLLLSDQDYIARYKQALDKKDTEYGLLRYIYDLTPNEKLLVRRLVKATVESVRVGHELRLEAIDENGMLIAYLNPEKRKRQEVQASLEPEEVEISIGGEGVIFERTEVDPKVDTDNLKNDRMEAMLEIMEMTANSTAETFLASLNGEKKYKLARIQAVFPKLTTNKLMSAKENGVITPVREQPISLEDVIRVTIHSDTFLRNIFSIRKYRDRVNSIIEKVISENLERVQTELSGQED